MRPDPTFLRSQLKDSIVFTTTSDSIDFQAMINLLPALDAAGKLTEDAVLARSGGTLVDNLIDCADGAEYFITHTAPSRWSYLRRANANGYEWELFTHHGVGDDECGALLYEVASLIVHPELAAASGITGITAR